MAPGTEKGRGFRAFAGGRVVGVAWGLLVTVVAVDRTRLVVGFTTAVVATDTGATVLVVIVVVVVVVVIDVLKVDIVEVEIAGTVVAEEIGVRASCVTVDPRSAPRKLTTATTEAAPVTSQIKRRCAGAIFLTERMFLDFPGLVVRIF